MKHLFKFFSIVAVLIAAPLGIARAADMALKAPPPPPPCLWCGFYFGGNAGGAWGRDAISTTQSLPTPPFFAIDDAAVSSAASQAVYPSGFTGGGQVGYNMQSGRWVYGVEADFGYLGLRGSRGGTFPFPSTLPGGPVGPPTTFFSTATSDSTNWLFTARPRVGWTCNNWLLFATGGLAVGRQNFSQTISLLPPFVSTNSFAATQVGWTIGAGVEYALNKRWSLKAEYLYVDLGPTRTNASVLTPPFAGFVEGSSAHLTTNIARAGINFHL
jgi:outer membrane immunogenic protein